MLNFHSPLNKSILPEENLIPIVLLRHHHLTYWNYVCSVFLHSKEYYNNKEYLKGDNYPPICSSLWNYITHRNKRGQRQDVGRHTEDVCTYMGVKNQTLAIMEGALWTVPSAFTLWPFHFLLYSLHTDHFSCNNIWLPPAPIGSTSMQWNSNRSVGGQEHNIISV